MDVSTSESGAILSEPLGRSSCRFALFMAYVLLLANVFLQDFVVTAIALTYIVFSLILSGLRMPKDIWRYLAIPLILIGLGFINCFGHDQYDSLKDAWYIVNPALVISTAYLIMKRVGDIGRLLRVLVIAGFILSVYHILQIASNPALLFNSSASVGAFRQEIGTGYLLSCISLVILLFSNRFGIELFSSGYKKFFVPLMLLITAASLVLTLSRTMWGIFLIIIFVMLGQFTIKRARIFVYVAAIMTVIITLQTLNSAGQASHDTIAGKLVDSFDELIFRDYSRFSDISLHWRGYESYWALQTYLGNGLLNLVIGHGLGMLVDIKINILLGASKFRYIPILHNGFMYILVKTGAAGVTLFLTYLYLFYKDGSVLDTSKDRKDVFVGRMLIALSLVLAFSTFVFMGYFHKTTMVSAMFFIGILLAYARARRIRVAK